MVIELPPDFKEFLKLLNFHRVDYLLIGGFAVGFHGYPRATSDIDIWVGSSPENAKRVVAAIREFGFDTPNLKPELFQQDRKIVRLGHPPIRIEVMNCIDGVVFEQCRKNLIEAEFDGIPVPMINLSDLKTNKKPVVAQRTWMTCSICPERTFFDRIFLLAETENSNSDPQSRRRPSEHYHNLFRAWTRSVTPRSYARAASLV